MIDRRQFLAAAVVVPMPGLRFVQAERDTFVIPHHAWRALASAAIVTRRFFVIEEKVSADSAAVMAHVISDCPEDLSFYSNLYYGCFEPTPARDAGHKWLTDERSEQRLQRLCAFLRRGGFGVEKHDGWMVLHRELGHAQ